MRETPAPQLDVDTLSEWQFRGCFSIFVGWMVDMDVTARGYVDVWATEVGRVVQYVQCAGRSLGSVEVVGWAAGLASCGVVSSTGWLRRGCRGRLTVRSCGGRVGRARIGGFGTDSGDLVGVQIGLDRLAVVTVMDLRWAREACPVRHTISMNCRCGVSSCG